MRIRVTSKDLAEQIADLAVCFAFEGDRAPRAIGNASLRRHLAREMQAAGFRGRPGDKLLWNANGGYRARRFLVLGLGSPAGGGELRIGGARAAREAQEHAARTLALRLPGSDPETSTAEAREAAEGVILGSYRFDRYLTQPERRMKDLASLELSVAGPLPAARRSVSRAATDARAVCIARDLVNEPPSRLTPTILARKAQKLAREGKLRSKVLGPAEIRKAGLHALLAVSRGSAEPPRVVHLVYRPRKARTKGKILLVGKGVTFDSGGLNLKTGDSMLTMKCDMGGAAAVLATMSVLDEIGCPTEVHALLGLVENMTGAAAYKPGDILTTWAGKTVEIGNTDAEGRLVLCDLLAWGAAKIKPTRIVDLATLTGACVVALGTRASGLFARDDELRDELLAAAAVGGEKVWAMPMYEEYLSSLQKGPADLRNVGDRWGGAITAALFLGEFVPRTIPWAHLDIAGPAFTEEEIPESVVGGTGAGVPTLLRWLGRA
jgi:leucyl aminopeptidase